MKVRCIDDKWIGYGKLSINNIYEVQDENKFYYEVIDDLGRDIYFKKERFEVV